MRMIMKKTVLFILAALMCLSLIACGGNQSGTIETTVKEVTPEGNLILEADIDDLEGEAIIPGNEVLVEVGTYKALVLFNKDILEGQGIDQMYANLDEETVYYIFVRINYNISWDESTEEIIQIIFSVSVFQTSDSEGQH